MFKKSKINAEKVLILIIGTHLVYLKMYFDVIKSYWVLYTAGLDLWSCENNMGMLLFSW